MKLKAQWMAAIAIAGVLVTTTSWAGDEPTSANQAKQAVAEASREQARIANEEAARLAAKAVKAATRLDLDIRLIGPTSVKIAGDS